MASRDFKSETERFVRKALAACLAEKPSEKNVRQAVTRIVREFQPVISGNGQTLKSPTKRRWK